MAVVLNQELTGNGRKDARQGQCARRKMMMAAEWGKQLLPLFFFYSTVENLWTIPAVRSEEGTKARI
jgi:hypothetical protein